MTRGTDWGGFAFWLFIAAIVVAGTWEKIRRNAEKHATLRTIIEKTGTVDEAKIKELFSQPANDWMTSTPGDGYRALRIGGTIIMGIGVALALFFFVMRQFSVVSSHASTVGVSIAFAVVFVGIAFFFSSRYAQPPPDRGDGRPAK